ncbi:MAG: hypothetical protein IJM69_09865 [Firmicutes bacterium]|nr:hypothetical protein [Bacillota bacterium]
MTEYALGIDTSNYKTSVALTDRTGRIVCDVRRFLAVAEGKRGLRQQEALFQHVNALPDLLEELFRRLDEDDRAAEKPAGEKAASRIRVVAASTRPRPVAGSYMPCFNAGAALGRSLAAAFDVPFRAFSHQEGHIMAVKRHTPLAAAKRLCCFHFSGGTTEALLWEEGEIRIAGGTKDIAFGQVLDRMGVALGLAFPAGEELDRLAAAGDPGTLLKSMPRLRATDGWLNLSGLETWCSRKICGVPEEERDPAWIAELAASVFHRFAEAIRDLVLRIQTSEGIDDFLFAGGVSSSQTLRMLLAADPRLKKAGVRLVFSEPALASDNAVGIAYLGGDSVWL